ncbi:related to bifunctional polynucleotide phosphatase/kinase [Fusarium oxysporum]|uniref:Related to bifunctional polynucleotide phosphatase/kinase n=1 Tax=Fusarium oxysporum TaxID=5507 RepID=A0A2H3SSK1_FUSOX|nr:related to bifunctional polynucleotide phosphatase/kinase [Fusarium oxysporum]
MPSSDLPKRKASDAPVSPPPLKRKLQSGTTKTAVANFFTPASQKPKDPTVWSERSPNDDTPATLLVGRFDGVKEDETIKRRKIAAFDLDSTLISTASGKKHAGSGTDWKWWDNSVPAKLRELYQDGYRVVILSNQAGLTLHFDPKSKAPKANAQKRVTEFKQKCSAVLNSLNLPTCVYAATEHDIYRKPRTGMWKELCDDYDISESEIDLGNSVFVGDAGGRTATLGKGPDGVAAAAKDFSCSDRNFAHNVGIQYQTPEEFFLGHKPRSFAREFDLSEHPFVDDAESGNSVVTFDRTNDKDIILFCGPPGAGKSTFYWKSLKPLGYERINQDQLKTRDKCVQAAREHLQAGKPIAIDNTNADPETRTIWVELAKKFGISIRCVWFRTPLQVCEHNNAVRALNTTLNPESRQILPKMAFTGFASRFKPPQMKEGFQDITEVQFQFRGSQDEYKIWGRYWT